jgi:hypothetical protein
MDAWRDNPGLICVVSVVLFGIIAWLILRPLGWRKFLGRCPLLIVTGVPFLFVAAVDLPEAFRRQFERHLDHSINDMVYWHVSATITNGENWIALWGERCGTVFDYLILGSAIWAMVNLIRRDSPLSNVLTLCLGVGWFFLFVWASMARFPF